MLLDGFVSKDNVPVSPNWKSPYEPVAIPVACVDVDVFAPTVVVFQADEAYLRTTKFEVVAPESKSPETKLNVPSYVPPATPEFVKV